MDIRTAFTLVDSLDRAAGILQEAGRVSAAETLDRVSNLLEERVQQIVPKAAPGALEMAKKEVGGHGIGADLQKSALESLRGVPRQELNKGLEELNDRSKAKEIVDQLGGLVGGEDHSAALGKKLPVALALLILGLAATPAQAQQSPGQSENRSKDRTEQVQQQKANLGAIVSEAFSRNLIPKPTDDQVEKLGWYVSWGMFLEGAVGVPGYLDILEKSLGSEDFQDFLREKFTDETGNLDKDAVVSFVSEASQMAVDRSGPELKEKWSGWAKKKGKGVSDLKSDTEKFLKANYDRIFK